MKKNVIGRAGTAFALVGALALAGCSGSSAPSEDAVSSVLDPSDPVQVELWTYYNGTQQQAFETSSRTSMRRKARISASW